MLRPVEPEDLIEINQWYRDRGKSPPPRELLPPSGLIWPGVAAGYLIQTNANIVFLEHFVTNPKAKTRLREVALEKVAESLIRAALSKGTIAIYALTQSPRIERLTKHFNFVKTPAYDMWVFKR